MSGPMTERGGTEPDRGTRAAWAAVLIGPAAWAAQLYGSWFMSEVIACAPSADPAGTLLGLPIAAAATVWNGALLALTAGSLVAALRDRRSSSASADPATGGVGSWLSRAGVITSALFTVLIAGSFLPILLVAGCR
jgi:energy-converting hydrogenase Eha subunit B